MNSAVNFYGNKFLYLKLYKIVRDASNSAKKSEKRLVVMIFAGNGLKCEYVRETAKSAISHPPHLIVASGEYSLAARGDNNYFVLNYYDS